MPPTMGVSGEMVMQALFCPFFKMAALAGRLWEDVDLRVNICEGFGDEVLDEKNH